MSTSTRFRQRMRLTTRVSVTIDTLVLRDFAAGAREAIAASLGVELKRLLAAAENGFGSSRSLAAVTARRLHVAADASPQHIGALAARQIVRGVLP